MKCKHKLTLCVTAMLITSLLSTCTVYARPTFEGENYDFSLSQIETWSCQADENTFKQMLVDEGYADANGVPTADATSLDNYIYAIDQDEYPAYATTICADANATTDEEKVLAIHDWICENMFYDDYYNNNMLTYNPLAGIMPNGTKSAFERRGGVCQDFAYIFLTMCRSQGIPTVNISGLTHAFNSCYYDGTWHHIDCTWDCRNSADTEDLSDLTTEPVVHQYFDTGLFFWMGHKPEGIEPIMTESEIQATIKNINDMYDVTDDTDNTDSNNTTPTPVDPTPTTPSDNDDTTDTNNNNTNTTPVTQPTQNTNNTDSDNDNANVSKSVTTKKSQKITCKIKTKTYKRSQLKKKQKTFKLNAKAKTALTYKLTKYPKNGKKYVKISPNGKVVIKKGAKKGTYKITITAKSTSKYMKATKTVKIIIK